MGGWKRRGERKSKKKGEIGKGQTKQANEAKRLLRQHSSNDPG